MRNTIVVLALVLLIISLGRIEYQEYQKDQQDFLRQEAFDATNTLINNPNLTVLEARKLADTVDKAVGYGVVRYSELGMESDYDTARIVYEAENREYRASLTKKTGIVYEAKNRELRKTMLRHRNDYLLEEATVGKTVGNLTEKALMLSDLPNGTINYASEGSAKYLLLQGGNLTPNGYHSIVADHGLIICHKGSMSFLLDKSGKPLTTYQSFVFEGDIVCGEHGSRKTLIGNL